jgi:hypothetical protein
MKTTIKHDPGSCRSDPPIFTIETTEDYELAKNRVQALWVQDGSSARELAALKAAIRIWESQPISGTPGIARPRRD